MQISEAERQALKTCISLADTYGYGNVISHLRTAWAQKLVSQGFPASGAVVGDMMPFQMHRDIIDEGMWDETGERYRITGGGCSGD